MNLRYSILKRLQSSSTSNLSPGEKNKQAAQLAIQSLKDFGSLLSNSSEDVQPIDPKPIYQDPTKFSNLSLLHQGQIIKELQEKFDKSWKKLSIKDKKLAYYIYFGNWGVREDFKNWNLDEPPYDLPFKIPSKIKNSNPKPNDFIKKLNPVILGETPIRKPQFDYKKMDGVSKFFIFLTLLISLIAISRDKKIGEEGIPKEIIIKDDYEIKRQQEIKEKEEEVILQEKLQELKMKQSQSSRKWYYLWLR
ncbi:unnamed protein product [Candida verbasci]|uniref:Genetic interactor of prohibitin 7, mitochondrial n=1 Tax=Candida verbasci TaxID=1227364 RepID=A0A9W4U1E2_9ASCO|nr:unnamed protein product [Candida verbasci]